MPNNPLDGATEIILSDWSIPPRRQRGPRLPTQLTPRIRARLIEGILDGLSHTQAARYAGIAPGTLAKWIKRGEMTRSGPEHDLVRIIEVAEAQLERALIVAIKRAAFENGDWRAAEALLKRRFPDRWGDRQRVDLHVLEDEARKLAERYPELDIDEMQRLAEEIILEART